MKVLVFILTLFLSSQVLAGTTRAVHADQLQSADKTKTFTLPSGTDTLLGSSSSQTISNKEIIYGIQELTNNYTFLSTDDLILCDGSSSGFTITLPTAVGASGKIYTIRKTDSSSNIINIATTGIETVDGASSSALHTEGESLAVVSDGSNWLRVSREIPTVWTSFTPTGSWNTNVTYTGLYRRIGKDIEVKVNIALSGAPNSASLTINTPSGISIDTGEIINASTEIVGKLTAVSGNYLGSVKYLNTTTLSALLHTDNGTYEQFTTINETRPITFGSGDAVTLYYKVPVSGWNQ